MILDLRKFIEAERPFWKELEDRLNELAEEPVRNEEIARVRRFHYLYQRASADLAKVTTFSAEPEIRQYLESLVARAYGEIHATQGRSTRFSPLRWFCGTFPRTVRAHSRALALATLMMFAGAILGSLALVLDEEAKEIVMPFSHLTGDPSERVAEEEAREGEHLAGEKTSFSAMLMTHNTRVAIMTLAAGISWGIGTIVVLFYNGVILGAVGMDYVLAGETVFLFAWLLPHGSVEIPAILLAGQGGLILAAALIGRGSRATLGERMREASGALVTIIGGVAILLVWAGLVEAFLSQYHYPIIPYWLKIAFGAGQLILLGLFLMKAGVSVDRDQTATRVRETQANHA